MNKSAQAHQRLPRTPDGLIALLREQIALMTASRLSVSADYYLGRAISHIQNAIHEIEDWKLNADE